MSLKSNFFAIVTGLAGQPGRPLPIDAATNL